MKPLALLSCGVVTSTAFVQHPPVLAGSFKALFMTGGSGNPLVNSRLSRVKLYVPDVPDITAFWETQGGSLKYYGGPSWALLALGGELTVYEGLALELEQISSSDFDLGNALSRIEVRLPKPALVSEPGEAPRMEPNGISVQKKDGASLDDFYCKVVLRTNDLEESKDFYLQLGMSIVDADENRVCLRYKPRSSDVPATYLVLERTDEAFDFRPQTILPPAAIWNPLVSHLKLFSI
jgi:hypothetical protein